MAEKTVIQEEQLDNIVTMHGKEFTINPPDGLVVLRILRILSRVVLRAEAEAKELGMAIFKDAVSEIKEGAGAQGVGLDAFLPKVMVFISILGEDDLLKLGAALLQFPDETHGVRWLQKNGVQLAPLTQALVLNLNQLNDVIEALRVFTPTLSGLRMMTSLATAAQAAQEVPGPTPSASSEN